MKTSRSLSGLLCRSEVVLSNQTETAVLINEKANKVLVMKELWVDFCICKVYPGFLGHRITDVKQVEHIQVILLMFYLKRGLFVFYS